MRISDWSSDVCSSDLGIGDAITLTVHQRPRLREQLRILLGFAAAEGTAGEHGISLRAQCSSASTIAAPFNGNTSVTSLYVTGTDTGVGQSRVSATLLQALRLPGLRAVAMKPVASGSVQNEGTGQNATRNSV